MSRTGTRIATIAAAAGGLATAFLALSPTAAADPAAPVIPQLPGGINLVQQLSNAPAMASQLLQSAASMLQQPTATSPIAAPASTPTTASPGTAATAAGPAPTASASLNLPQPPISAPMTSAVGTVPTSQLPTSTNPLQMLSQLGLPSNLSALPMPNLSTPPAPAAPATPGQSALPPNLNPFSALP